MRKFVAGEKRNSLMRVVVLRGEAPSLGTERAAPGAEIQSKGGKK